MDYTEYEKLITISRRLVRNVLMSKMGFLLDRIDWRDGLICIEGALGTGKTTLILQHINRSFRDNPNVALYVSMDNMRYRRPKKAPTALAGALLI